MGIKNFFRKLFKRDKVFNVDRDGFPKFKEWPMPPSHQEIKDKIKETFGIEGDFSFPEPEAEIPMQAVKIGGIKPTEIKSLYQEEIGVFYETEENLKRQREELKERLIEIEKKLMIFNNHRNCQETAAQDKEFMEMGMTPVILNGTFCYIGPPGKPDKE